MRSVTSPDRSKVEFRVGRSARRLLARAPAITIDVRVNLECLATKSAEIRIGEPLEPNGYVETRWRGVPVHIRSEQFAADRLRPASLPRRLVIGVDGEGRLEVEPHFG